MYVIVYADNVTHTTKIIKAFKDFELAKNYCVQRGYRTVTRHLVRYITPKGTYTIKKL